MPHPASLKARGLTLLEVLVAAALALLLLGVLVQFSSIAYRVGREEIDRSGAEAALLMTATRLLNDIELTAPAGVSLLASGQKALFHPVELSPSGRVAYAERLVLWIYDPAGKRLTRFQSEDAPSPPVGGAYDGLPIRLDETALGALDGSGGFTVSSVMENIESFTLTVPPGIPLPSIGGPLTLEMTRRLDIVKTRQRIQVRRVINFRT